MEVIFLKREVEKKLSYEQAIYISNELKKLHKILLPSVFEESFFDFDSTYKILYGSRVSAKSYVKGLELLYKAVHQKYFRCLFARETQKDSRDTQFLLFKDIITKMYPWLASEFTIKESSMMIVHNKTGHFLKGASFEDPPRFILLVYGNKRKRRAWLVGCLLRLDNYFFITISNNFRQMTYAIIIIGSVINALFITVVLRNYQRKKK